MSGEDQRVTAGVNVLGFFRAEFGQGEAARRVIKALERAEIPFVTVPHKGVPQRQAHPFEHEPADPVFDVTIACLNAEHLLELPEKQLRATISGRYTIGVWFWEVSIFPAQLLPAFDLVDEVWVASDFVRDVLSPLTLKPVLTFPMLIEPPAPAASAREALGLPADRFLFLFTFDLYSTLERKNALGLVEAFKRAFPANGGPLLYLKTINGDVRTQELERLRLAVGAHPDILVVDEYLTSDEVSGLMETCDCYVSLHRSEGFGLTIAEAMSRGKPVITTGYSGSLEFTSPDVAYLVPYQLSAVPEGCEPYPPGSVWADPDVDEAALLMRRVVERPTEAHSMGERGRRHVLDLLSAERSAEFMSRRLELITRARTDSSAQTGAFRARRYLADGPSIPWDAPSRAFGSGRWLRLALRRLLKPYLVRHREFESAVAAGLGELEAVARTTRDRVAAMETSVRRLDELTRRVRELEGQSATPESAAAKRTQPDGGRPN